MLGVSEVRIRDRVLSVRVRADSVEALKVAAHTAGLSVPDAMREAIVAWIGDRDRTYRAALDRVRRENRDLRVLLDEAKRDTANRMRSQLVDMLADVVEKAGTL